MSSGVPSRRGLRPPGRALAWGLAAAAAYAVLALIAFGPGGLPVRPLYDGLAPPQVYRWVTPPEELAHQNVPPEPGAGEVALEADGSVPGQLSTDDGQARLVLPQGVFPSEEGATAVSLRLTPLDPATLAPPPEGVEFAGNAYRADATYVPSGAPAVPQRNANIVLRYPTVASSLLRFTGSGWTEVPDPRDVPAGLQLFANIQEMGVYVAAGKPAQEDRSTLVFILSAAAGVLALGLGLWVRRRSAGPKRTKPRPPPRPRTPAPRPKPKPPASSRGKGGGRSRKRRR